MVLAAVHYMSPEQGAGCRPTRAPTSSRSGRCSTDGHRDDAVPGRHAGGRVDAILTATAGAGRGQTRPARGSSGRSSPRRSRRTAACVSDGDRAEDRLLRLKRDVESSQRRAAELADSKSGPTARSRVRERKAQRSVAVLLTSRNLSGARRTSTSATASPRTSSPSCRRSRAEHLLADHRSRLPRQAGHRGRDRKQLRAGLRADRKPAARRRAPADQRPADRHPDRLPALVGALRRR